MIAEISELLVKGFNPFQKVITYDETGAEMEAPTLLLHLQKAHRERCREKCQSTEEGYTQKFRWLVGFLKKQGLADKTADCFRPEQARQVMAQLTEEKGIGQNTRNFY